MNIKQVVETFKKCFDKHFKKQKITIKKYNDGFLYATSDKGFDEDEIMEMIERNLLLCSKSKKGEE